MSKEITKDKFEFYCNKYKNYKILPSDEEGIVVKFSERIKIYIGGNEDGIYYLRLTKPKKNENKRLFKDLNILLPDFIKQMQEKYGS